MIYEKKNIRIDLAHLENIISEVTNSTVEVEEAAPQSHTDIFITHSGPEYHLCLFNFFISEDEKSFVIVYDFSVAKIVDNNDHDILHGIKDAFFTSMANKN